ncbi:MAG: hypothetical protein II968_05815 [Selenomonadaceae bacterium]|nr:hypothetical protein [Selenomonadaceae bacterium]
MKKFKAVEAWVALQSRVRSVTDMKKFKAVEACDVVYLLAKIEDKLVGILKLDPPEQKDAIEALLDFIQDVAFELLDEE